MEIGDPAPFRLAVYDVMGRLVEILFEGPAGPGRRDFIFEGRNLPAGTYFYRLVGNGRQTTGALTLVR